MRRCFVVELKSYDRIGSAAPMSLRQSLCLLACFVATWGECHAQILVAPLAILVADETLTETFATDSWSEQTSEFAHFGSDSSELDHETVFLEPILVESDSERDRRTVERLVERSMKTKVYEISHVPLGNFAPIHVVGVKGAGEKGMLYINPIGLARVIRRGKFLELLFAQPSLKP